jgi:hypothetical protein
MTKSILSNDRQCYFCGRGQWLERHHIFPASNRKKSERDGLWVDLCHACHNEPPDGVHHNQEKNIELRKEAELAWIHERYGVKLFYDEYLKKGIEEFRKEYGINYL